MLIFSRDKPASVWSHANNKGMTFGEAEKNCKLRYHKSPRKLVLYQYLLSD